MPTKTGHKYLICDAANPSWGKTTTLTEVINIFKTLSSAFNMIDRKLYKNKAGQIIDEWIVFQEVATSKTILIQTQGDEKQSFNYTNEYLETGSIVDIIICASHLNGPSWNAVERIVKRYGYTQINFSNFCPLNSRNRKKLFQIPAISDVNKVHLAQLIYNFVLAL